MIELMVGIQLSMKISVDRNNVLLMFSSNKVVQVSVVIRVLIIVWVYKQVLILCWVVLLIFFICRWCFLFWKIWLSFIGYVDWVRKRNVMQIRIRMRLLVSLLVVFVMVLRKVCFVLLNISCVSVGVLLSCSQLQVFLIRLLICVRQVLF